jgi:hypothetical protein
MYCISDVCRVCDAASELLCKVLQKVTLLCVRLRQVARVIDKTLGHYCERPDPCSLPSAPMQHTQFCQCTEFGFTFSAAMIWAP